MPYRLVRATKATPLAPARWELLDDSGYMAAYIQKTHGTWTSQAPSGQVLASTTTKANCVEKTIEELRPLTCEYCGTTFSVDLRLRLHLSRAHP